MPQFLPILQIFYKKVYNFLPRIPEEILYTLLIYRLFKAFHQDYQNPHRYSFPGSIIQPLMYFICCHDLFVVILVFIGYI